MSHHEEDEKTIIFGKEYNMPVYTSVFVALGILTIVEVLISEIIAGNAKVPILLGMAGAKAFLVVYFYMHLKSDSKVFSFTLVFTSIIALIAILYLIGVPPTGGY